MKKSILTILLYGILITGLTGCNNNYTKLKDEVEVGDYIYFQPKSKQYIADSKYTGAESNQSISVEKLNTWIVTKINAASIEVMSINVTDDELCFNGKTGYMNYIYVLNDFSDSFKQNNGVINGRAFGYSNQSEIITDDVCIENYYLCKNKERYNGVEVEELGLGDENYYDDYELASNMNILMAGNQTYGSTKYWVASREVSSTTPTYWMGKYVDSGRNLRISTEVLYETDSLFSETKNDEHCHSVRPILTIDLDTNIISGDGKSIETAYKLK